MFSGISEDEGLSANKRSELPNGVYREEFSNFESDDGAMSLVIRKFKRDGDEGFSVIDLILFDLAANEVKFLDLMLLPDGGWRRSDGFSSSDIEELMPIEIEALRQVGGSGIGDVIEVAKGAAR